MSYFYMDGGYYGHDFRQNNRLYQDINKAINDEFSAIHYYTRLAELAPNEQFRQQILAVRQDEINHFAIFSAVFFELTKGYPQISLKVDLPNSFRNGVRESVRDEQQTVPFYSAIAGRLTNTNMKNIFLRAANDEQRHYQLFSNLNSYV